MHRPGNHHEEMETKHFPVFPHISMRLSCGNNPTFDHLIYKILRLDFRYQSTLHLKKYLHEGLYQSKIQPREARRAYQSGARENKAQTIEFVLKSGLLQHPPRKQSIPDVMWKEREGPFHALRLHNSNWREEKEARSGLGQRTIYSILGSVFQLSARDVSTSPPS